jgi:signal peptidase
MEPLVQRGDLLLLSLSEDRIVVGDICVYKLKGKDIPIVHRVIKVHDESVACVEHLEHFLTSLERGRGNSIS